MSDSLCSLRELYALGGLSDAERSAFKTHLLTCTECQREVKALEAVTEALLFDMEPVSPPTGMRQRVLDNILGATDDDRGSTGPKADASAEPNIGAFAGPSALDSAVYSTVHSTERTMKLDTAKLTPPRAQRSVSRTRSWMSFTAAAIVLMVIASGVTYSVANRTGASPFGHVQKSMALNSKMPGATATMWVTKTESASQMVIHFTHLKPVGGTQVYQVWLINSGSSVPYSAGVFTPDSQGNAVFASIMPQGSYQVVAVTLEPKAIDAKPLGPVVFEAET
ncbi:anti-sigma factor [Alicyclobacillus ferrooxydans]|uniref:Anti-sigma-W factor RsiW n=1 Tax=Alicyclobacillus ferrooxydans TaxID=471514 RepID=A0A0P9CCA3_9BACL|nr:anti-sigma factor [Alicyclobacillus ferrooxydans]KPV40539.1 hypothetical protein AN477_21925 [Alicyclobacillus ferrooxydans]